MYFVLEYIHIYRVMNNATENIWGIAKILDE